MIHFPVINIPQGFSHILQSNMQSSSSRLTELRDTIYSDLGMRSLLMMTLGGDEKNFDIGRAIKANGWEGVRNRLAAMYLSYAQNGRFKSEPDEELLDFPLEVEKRLRSRIVAGYSRAFLFGIYLQMGMMGRTPGGKEFIFEIDEFLIKALEMASGRIVKIDWMILTLYHLRECFGDEELVAHLKSSIDFNELYQKMNDEQREALVGNFLSYGASIDDNHIFHVKTV